MRSDPGFSSRIADQPVQDVEDVSLGGNTGLKRQLDRAECGLLVILQDQCQDFHHLAVATYAPEKLSPQSPERVGHLGEERTIAQSSRLALHHRQIVAPVIDGYRLLTDYDGGVAQRQLVAIQHLHDTNKSRWRLVPATNTSTAPNAPALGALVV